MSNKSFNPVPKLAKVLAAASRQIDSLADKYRSEVLIPLCRRLNMTFTAGMGRTVFYFENDQLRIESVGDIDDAILSGQLELIPIFEVLNTRCFGSSDLFGFHVDDIRKEDL